MKIADAISYADSFLKNTISIDLKIRWLAELDGKILIELFGTHTDSEGNTLSPADGSWTTYVNNLVTPSETITVPIQQDELFAEFPYDDMYIHLLLYKMYFAVQEINKANNELTEFNDVYDKFASYINRTYLPLQNNRFITGVDYYV